MTEVDAADQPLYILCSPALYCTLGIIKTVLYSLDKIFSKWTMHCFKYLERTNSAKLTFLHFLAI